jgi:hypothetical protein
MRMIIFASQSLGRVDAYRDVRAQSCAGNLLGNVLGFWVWATVWVAYSEYYTMAPIGDSVR